MKIINLVLIALALTGSSASTMTHLTATYKGLGPYEFVGGTRVDDSSRSTISIYEKYQWNHMDLDLLKSNYSTKDEMNASMKNQGWTRSKKRTGKHLNLHIFEKDVPEIIAVKSVPSANDVSSAGDVSSANDAEQWIAEATYKEFPGPVYKLIEAKEHGTPLKINNQGRIGCAQLNLRLEFSSLDQLQRGMLKVLEGWKIHHNADSMDTGETLYKFVKSSP